MKVKEIDVKEEVQGWALGYGLTAAGGWFFAFYPAFIISLGMGHLFFGFPEDGSDAELGAFCFSVLIAIIMTFLIICLVVFKQWFIILMLYGLTLWPFLCILHHWWENSGEWENKVLVNGVYVNGVLVEGEWIDGDQVEAVLVDGEWGELAVYDTLYDTMTYTNGYGRVDGVRVDGVSVNRFMNEGKWVDGILVDGEYSNVLPWPPLDLWPFW